MNAEAKKAGWWKWLLPVLVVVIVAAGVIFFSMKSGGTVTGDQLADEKDYLISVSRVELSNTKPNGKPWDMDKSAPDIYVKIKWRNDEVYKSSVKENNLIAQWPEHELNVLKAIRTGVADGSKHGARVRFRPADYIELSVIDKDLLKDDVVDTIKIFTDKLKVGKNEIKPENSPVLRIELRVTPLEAQ